MFAIKWVGSQTGEVPSAVGYDKVREGTRQRLSRRYRHVLPTAAQITQVTETWDAALAVAGFEARQPDRASGGVFAADMIRAFVRANTAWPTKRALEQFGQDTGVRWRRPHQDGVTLRDVVSDVHREMTADGENPPALTARWNSDRGRPDVDANAGEFAAAPAAAEVWSLAAATDAVADWLQSQRGHEVTWRAYIADAAGNPMLPKGSTITRLGGWAHIRAQARRDQ